MKTLLIIIAASFLFLTGCATNSGYGTKYRHNYVYYNSYAYPAYNPFFGLGGFGLGYGYPYYNNYYNYYPYHYHYYRPYYYGNYRYYNYRHYYWGGRRY